MAAMEDLLQEAKEKGLFLVNSEESTEEKHYETVIQALKEAETLCEINDPEETPYQSKYQARDLLDNVCKQLEANKTIASLEKKKEFIEFLSLLYAKVQIKIATISWDCEEPHHTEQELTRALCVYYPQFIEEIDILLQDRDERYEKESANQQAIDLEALDREISSLPLPILPSLPLDRWEKERKLGGKMVTATNFAGEVLVDILKCFNLFGILWSGRGQIFKSLTYLLTAKTHYQKYSTEFFHHHQQQQGKKITASDTTPSKEEKEFELTYTHTLFYLAQAFGNLKLAKSSSEYCKLTLQRQLIFGLEDLKTALEWVKNCCGLSDFYLSQHSYRLAALALSSAEMILKEKIIRTLYNEMEKQMKAAAEGESGGEKGKEGGEMKKKTNEKPNFASGNLNAAEIEADLHKRWVFLDSHLLKEASDRWKLLLANNNEEGIDECFLNPDEDSVYSQLLIEKIGDPPVDKIRVFEHLPVSVMTVLRPLEINSFEDARIVFLRATSRLEQAKKYFVLDGHVTDHCSLLQEHSKLYHYLASFENDIKRKLAMEARRIELLDPILKSLNRVSYEVLHKQISYELGETSLCLLDLKLDKLRTREGGAIDESSLKKAEILKCNEYAKAACSYFTHFTFMYAQAKDRKEEHYIKELENLKIHEIVSIFCSHPDESLISEEEVRPFLNANFLSCRIMSKIIAHSTSIPKGASKAHYLVQCLHRYEWIVKFAPKICLKTGLDLQLIFGEEYQIAQDMVKLLPSKIDRMCYLGESGLSL